MSVGNRLRQLVGLGAEGRGRLVTAALDLLDEAGLEGLTMRTLAERLGMRAASLYWHIRDKDQLLGLLAEAIVAEVPEPAADLPWRAQLEAFAAGYRRVLQSHRDAARVVIMAQPTAPRLYERLVRPLLEAPLGALARGRLELNGGVAGMRLRSDPTLAELYAGHFKGKLPTVEVQGGTVRIGLRYRRLQLRWWDIASVALNPAIPWDMVINGGVWKLHADLRGLRLRSLTVSGGVADMTLLLPPAAGFVPVRISGGVYKLIVHRPLDVAARVRVANGARRLTLDTMRIGAAEGEALWETPDFGAVADRYDVEVSGGAYRLTFDSAEAAGDEALAGPAPAGASPDRWAEPLAPEEFPILAPLAAHLANPDPDARFAFGLRTLLDGLERRLPSV